MSTITARNISVSLAGIEVLADTSFAVGSGETVGLVGPNGAGKTTLLRALAGLVPIDRGEINIDGIALGALGQRRLAQTLAYLPQGGGVQWPITVANLVMLGRLPHQGAWRGPSDRDRTAVATALAACDVADLSERPASHLSGGELARVLLARALAAEPTLLLADEPVAGLDPAHQLAVMGKLRNLAADGAGVVVVMHDLTLASRFCDRLALLWDKRITASGEPAAVLTEDNLARCYGIKAHRTEVGGRPVVVPLAQVAPHADA